MSRQTSDSGGEPKIAAILLAAGQGKRLGKAKALLELDGKPAVYHVFDELVAAKFSPLIVTLNPHVHKELAATGERFDYLSESAQIVLNPSPELGTLHSIRLGLEALETPADAVLFMPVDHPFIQIDTLKSLKRVANSSAIVIPTFDGKRGHPPIFGRDHLPGLFEIPLDEGARGVIRRAEGSIIEVETGDEGVLWNINTAADWEQHTVKRR
jgi:molybdenum cofactor cytidylyltransferase